MCTRSLVKSFKKKHPSEAAVPLLVQLECIDLAAVTIQGPKGRAREAGSDPLKIPPIPSRFCGVIGSNLPVSIRYR
jgi:hypothetical protein